MIDIKRIRENPELIIKKLEKRLPGGFSDDIERITKLDSERRQMLVKINNMKAERNAVSDTIPGMKKEGKDVEPVLRSMRDLGSLIDGIEQDLKSVESLLDELLNSLPNLPDDDLAAGGKENNTELRVFGKVPEFDFPLRSHIELCEKLNLIDYKRGVKLGGNGSWLYRNDGTRLEWALLNFFIDQHIKDGYEFVLPPHMLNWECGYGAGQFPKFSDEVYHIANPSSDEKKFLLPTAETALVNIHRDEILTKAELPKKYIAYTPCYRREAGSYRSEERGMIRGHQFNKVEMVQYTAADESDTAFEELLKKAESLMQLLGLCHRVSKLAAGDVSASMARTYDIEVWIPSIGIFKEVSSVSNARDFQARRGNIRYRNDAGTLEFAHTLNGSGLATSRVFPAIIEQYQNSDGSVRIPDVLVSYMGGQTELTGSR